MSLIRHIVPPQRVLELISNEYVFTSGAQRSIIRIENDGSSDGGSSPGSGEEETFSGVSYTISLRTTSSRGFNVGGVTYPIITNNESTSAAILVPDDDDVRVTVTFSDWFGSYTSRAWSAGFMNFIANLQDLNEQFFEETQVIEQSNDQCEDPAPGEQIFSPPEGQGPHTQGHVSILTSMNSFVHFKMGRESTVNTSTLCGQTPLYTGTIKVVISGLQHSDVTLDPEAFTGIEEICLVGDTLLEPEEPLCFAP